MRAVIKHEFVLDEDEGGEFCVIPVSRGKYFAKVSVEDYGKVCDKRWSVEGGWRRRRKIRYARTVCRINAEGRRQRHLGMHRFLMGVYNPKILVDHINGDGLDNRRSNLRIATNSQNCANSVARGGLSRYKGVTWHKEMGKWTAKICYLGNQIWLGGFSKRIVDGVDVGEIEAARAYDRAAMKYFGVFARLNFEGRDMAYVLSKDEVKRANELIRRLNEGEVISMSAWLMEQSVEDLEVLCRFVGCNISGLARGLGSYTQVQIEDSSQKTVVRRQKSEDRRQN